MEASYKSDIKSLSRPREHKNHFKSDDQSTIKYHSKIILIRENRETEAIRNLLSAPNSLRGFNSIKSDTSIMSKTFHSLDHERPFNLYHPKFFEKSKSVLGLKIFNNSYEDYNPSLLVSFYFA